MLASHHSPNQTNPERTRRLWLAVILLLALGLRLWGVAGLGLPRAGYVDDEPYLADPALVLLRQGQLNFSQWGIGSAQVFAQAAIGWVVFRARGLDPATVPTYGELIHTRQISASVIGVPYPAPEFYLWGRIFVAGLGALSVLLVYLLGHSLQSARVGLIGAFFVAVNSLHVEYSQYMLRTVPGAFLLLLALYAIIQACRRHSWWLYLASVGLTYLAIYTKQNNLILLAPLGLALALSLWREARQRPAAELAHRAGLAIGVLAGLLGLSWLLLGFNSLAYTQGIYNSIFHNAYLYEGYHFGFSGESTPRWLFEQIFTAPSATWQPMALLALPGALLALRRQATGWLLLGLLGPYLGMISLFSVRFLHWLMPALPVLALLAALALDWGETRLRQNTRLPAAYLTALFWLVVILLAAATLRATVTLNYYASQPDVRTVASEWMAQNLPPGSKIVVDSWGPYIDDTVHTVEYVPYIGDQELAAYRAAGVDYLVLNSFNLARLVSARADPRARELVELRISRLNQLIDTLQLERKFTGPALFNPPVIDVLIYRLP